MTLDTTLANPSYGDAASGSSFYAAMRILPPEQREAMFQIYSFCRQVDDIADSDGPRVERLAAIQQWRDDVDALYRGHPPARLADYLDSVQRFGLKREDFLAIVDGMEMDIPQDIRAPDLATLDLYCDRVASAVGRLSVRVFGLSEDEGVELAHHLGRALQLTNILRDIDEDAGICRSKLCCRPALARPIRARWWTRRRYRKSARRWSSARKAISRRPTKSCSAIRGGWCARPGSCRNTTGQS